MRIRKIRIEEKKNYKISVWGPPCYFRSKEEEIYPLATRDFDEKHVLKLVEAFFGHCRAV